ncbi:MAG: LacI family DNA-binding transcriptional regulator [Anaerolineae bacterium]
MSSSLHIEQIAEMAGVSRSTVSRVLNNHPSVRPEVRQRVLRIIEENGYAPRAAARSLASRRTQVIGLLIPRTAGIIFSDPFFGSVIQGVAEAAQRRGYFLMLSMMTADMEPGFYNRILKGGHFDGLIMLSSDIDDPILPLLIKDQMRLVLIGQHPFFHNVASVDVDNREGAYAGVTHLIKLGHRRIACVTGSLQMVAALERRDGYKQALLEAGIPILPELIVNGDFTQESGYTRMRDLLALTTRPTAVFVASDTMAVGALRAIHEAGLDIPDEIAVVGFDDLPAASYANPPLTTVYQPIAQLGAAAVELLIDGFDDPQRRLAKERLPTHLVIRASCGATRFALDG